MSHTNSTTNYHLPQFESTDKPAWLTDVNDAMSAIDTGIATAQSTADGNTTALADKVDKVAGKGLSENDYTTADKTKLTDLANIKSIGSNLTLVAATGELSATDTTYSNFTGTDGTAAGAAGLVPAPATTDAGKFLKADGTWDTAGGGGGTLYTTIGQNTDGAMTQKATSDMVFAGGNDTKIQIGQNSVSGTTNTVAIGPGAHTDSTAYGSIALGQNAYVQSGTGGFYLGSTSNATTHFDRGGGCIGYDSNNRSSTSIAIGHHTDITTTAGGGAIKYAVALGHNAHPTRTGEVNVGTGSQTQGFNSSTYRVIGGVYDGQEDHDVATVGQWKTSLTIAATAPSTPIDGELILYTGSVDSTFTASPAIYVYSASNTSWTHLTLQ